ncbi:MAG: metalloregulator ArsR/SmtB family transcription factor [Candidatus Doudnabacteria bacterium]|nr:metalloregulator ArsR/SmtB family transcription factor [Candidatus Doudnabacteria bacterium]
MKNIAIAQKPLTRDLSKKARILELAGDETRIRILCMLFDHQNICVSDLAKSLKMSIASISHHLQLLQDNELVYSARKGKNICYTLNKTPLIKYVKQFICHKE